MIFTFITNKIGGYFALRQKFKNSNSQLLKRIYLMINSGFQHETNSFLPFNNSIESPINFLHGTFGIFISGDAIIGKNCTMYHQVTIGSNMLLDSKGFGSPEIGDNCLIGVGAKIIGNVKIGDNCRIGANAIVTSSMEDNSVLVLGKPIVFKKDFNENKIYTKKNNK